MSGLLLIGGGGHCLSIIDALGLDQLKGAAIIEMRARIGETVAGIPIIGCDDDLDVLRADFDEAFISIGSVGNWKKREKILELLDALDYSIRTIVHPSAVVSVRASLGRGAFVGAGAVVNALAGIGETSILNTGCIVEHQCNIGRFAHIAPGAVLCGGVTVGKGSHIGARSVVKEGVSIGKNAMIGMGSVVTKDIPDGVVAFGTPCRVVRDRSDL